MALQTEDANIVFNGHSNYGVGIAFGKNFNTFDQFFNMAGGGLASISLTDIGPSHLGMQLVNPNGEYNVDVINERNAKAATDPVNRYVSGTGILPNVARYPLNTAPAGAPAPAIGSIFPAKTFPWTRYYASTGQTLSGTVTWHYYADAVFDGNGSTDRHTITACGNNDVPPAASLHYRSLFLNMCNSYRSFLESFPHGTVVSTWSCVSNNELTTIYTRGIVEGVSWPTMDENLEGTETIPDLPGNPKDERLFNVLTR
jgi:hypothetical protein